MKNLILLIAIFIFCNFQSVSANKKVSIVDVSGSELLLIIDLKTDKSFNEFFTIQYENIDFSILSALHNFELLSYNRNEVKVKSGSTILSFNLTSSGTSTEFMTYGIAHHSSDDGYLLKIISNGNSGGVFTKKKVTDTNNNSLECTSGGPGATQCGTGSSAATVSTQCDVTCGNGYYACCDDGLGKCGCVKNGMAPGANPSANYNISYYDCN